MRKELYKDSKLIEAEEILEKTGKIIFSRYDGQNNLLEEREATDEEKQGYQQEQSENQRMTDFQRIKTLAGKVSNLTTSEVQEALKLVLKHLGQ